MLSLWYKTTMLAIESQMVIGQRMAVLAMGGPAAQKEAVLMVSEKLAALAEANTSLMLGRSATSVVGRYRHHVKANAKRLAKRR